MFVVHGFSYFIADRFFDEGVAGDVGPRGQPDTRLRVGRTEGRKDGRTERPRSVLNQAYAKSMQLVKARVKPIIGILLRLRMLESDRATERQSDRATARRSDGTPERREHGRDRTTERQNDGPSEQRKCK